MRPCSRPSGRYLSARAPTLDPLPRATSNAAVVLPSPVHRRTRALIVRAADPDTGLAGLAQEQLQLNREQHGCCKQVAPEALHPTLKLIRDRLAAGTLPGQHNDGEKLALVVEGGGMQGIISAGMCLQISRLGLKNTFDAVYGASAGAVNGAYFIAGQHEGLHCYTEYCTRTEFLDLTHALPKVLPKALQGYYVKYVKSRSGPTDASVSQAADGNGASSSGSSGGGSATAAFGASDGAPLATRNGSGRHAAGNGKAHAGRGNGHSNSHGNGHSNSQGNSNGNGQSNGHNNGHGNGLSNGYSTQTAHGNGNGAAHHHGGPGVAASNGSRKGYWKSRLHDYWEDGALPRALREYWSKKSSALQSYWGGSSVSSLSSVTSTDEADGPNPPGAALSNVLPYQDASLAPSPSIPPPGRYSSGQAQSLLQGRPGATPSPSAAGRKQPTPPSGGSSPGVSAGTGFKANSKSGLNGAGAAGAATTAASAASASAAEVDRPAMDLEYLMGEVMERKIPLNWDAVLSSPLPLKAVASSLDTLEPILLSDFTDKADLVACLAASATVPEFAGAPRMVRGHRCVDAAVFEPVPLQSAIADGCTHALVLCSRVAAAPVHADASTQATVTRMAQGMAKKVMETVVKRTFLSAEYMAEAWAHDNSNSSYIHDELLLGALRGDPEDSVDQLGAYVLPLYPTSACGVNPICQDKDKLWAAREEGCRVVQEAIGLPLGLVDPAPEPRECPPPRDNA